MISKPWFVWYLVSPFYSRRCFLFFLFSPCLFVFCRESVSVLYPCAFRRTRIFLLRPVLTYPEQLPTLFPSHSHPQRRFFFTIMAAKGLNSTILCNPKHLCVLNPSNLVITRDDKRQAAKWLLIQLFLLPQSIRHKLSFVNKFHRVFPETRRRID